MQNNWSSCNEYWLLTALLTFILDMWSIDSMIHIDSMSSSQVFAIFFVYEYFLVTPPPNYPNANKRMTMNHSLRTFLSSIKPLNWIKFDIVELCSTVDKFSHLRISFHSTTIVVHLKKMWEAFSFFRSQTNMKFVIQPRCLFEIARFFNQINVSRPNPCIHLFF
jgi:hypothetical protein